jgi:serine/threonine protein kinase
VNTVLDGSYRIMRVVGSGGFGITYEAEDINLGTMVAIKEYYPFDFGDRDATMSVRPKSERHKQTFDWGRSNFLQEARTLARFEHPSIVRVTRVFEAHATAYMVMRFERGMSFEAWLASLGRPPSQEELDGILHPLLDALEMMHAANFLHRDIAPDNIIVRADGTPVLLDFGAARRAVAEMSRSLTGIVKAGYSPHEQYSSDGRLQGPWSDLYALGGTLYRAVTGKAPVEATLRFDEDQMPPAAKLAKGKYRRDFLTAIDTCLKVRHSERPRSVAQLRPMLLGRMSQPKATERLIEPTYKLADDRAPSQPRVPSLPRFSQATVQQVKRRWPAIAAMVAILGGAYGGYEYQRWLSEGAHVGTADAEAKRKAAAEAAQRQAALDAERRQKEKEAADARQRQIEMEEERRRKEMAEAQRQAELAEARRRKEQADAAEAEARRKAEEARKEEARLAALEAARRKAEAEAEEKRRIAAQEEARRKAEADAAEKRRIAALEDIRRAEEAEAERKRREEQRIAALEEARRSEDRRKEDERLRLAAIPNDSERAVFVRKIQEVLKRNRCYDGAVDGVNGNNTQEGLDRFLESAGKKGNSKPGKIEIAKATVGDFESWLKDADAIKGGLCAPPPKPEPEARPSVRKDPPVARRQDSPPRQYTPPRSYSPPRSGGNMGPIQGIQ